MATAYVSPASYTANGYFYQVKRNPDGSIGVDYFDATGSPVSNADFHQATGQDTSIIEENVRNDYESANTQEALYAQGQSSQNQTAGGTPITVASTLNAPTYPLGDPGSTTSYGSIPSYSSAAPSGTGSTTAPSIQYLNGTAYDLNDPNQALAYYAAQRDQYIADAQKTVQGNLSAAGETYGKNAADIATAINNVSELRKQYGKNQVKAIGDLGEGYDLGTVRRQEFFNALSPNAYQSSQGSSQLYAREQLNKGIGDIQSALATANENFTKKTQELDQSKSDLEKAYNAYVDSQKTYLTDAQQKAADFYNSAGATAYAPGGNTTGFSFNNPTFTPYEPPKVDLSSYTPYTTFTALSAANPGTAPTTSTPVTTPNLSGIEQYLGYTPTAEERSMLQKYLYS